MNEDEPYTPEGTARYGSQFWAIKTKARGTKKAEYVMANADRVEVSPNGDLLLWGGFRTGAQRADPAVIVIAFASGMWEHFFAASLFNGDPICVDSWGPIKAAP